MLTLVGPPNRLAGMEHPAVVEDYDVAWLGRESQNAAAVAQQQTQILVVIARARVGLHDLIEPDPTVEALVVVEGEVGGHPSTAALRESRRHRAREVRQNPPARVGLQVVDDACEVQEAALPP